MRMWGTLAVAGALLIAAASTTPAAAGTWREPDAAEDVTSFSYSPDPPPCGTFQEYVHPSDATTDIVALRVRHEREVELTARFRDLGGRGRQYMSFQVETDGRAFVLDVERDGPRAAVRSELWVAPREAPVPDECGTYGYHLLGRSCSGLSATMAPDLDVVAVTVPRPCLNRPRWIRAGVEAYRYLDGDRVRHDRWAPPGADETAVGGVLGPVVRRG